MTRPGTDPDQQRMHRPRVTFRVGVTGAAALPDPEPLQALAAAVLTDISDHVAACARHPSARRVYDPGPPLLRLISPLADGADRLVAAAAPDGYQLDVVLPFPKDAYKATFNPDAHEEGVAAFDALLERAGPRVLTLDGDTEDATDRRRGYEAVGRLVVRNCELLIAIWDDNTPAKGKGGTADTVQFAIRAGVPVWWIDAAGRHPPRWLQDTLDQPRLGEPGPDALPARDALREYVAKVILPPDPGRDQHASRWDRGIACLRNTLGIEADPLLALLHEDGLPNHGIWSFHPSIVDWIRKRGAEWHARHTGPPRVAPPVAAPAAGAALGAVSPAPKPARAWHETAIHCICVPFRRGAYKKASSAPARLSRLYQHRYRTSYLFVFVLGAIALVSSVIGLKYPSLDVPMTVTEFTCVSAILGLVMVNEVCRWHERYVSYRMLGELLRLSSPLRPLGWSLAGTRVNNMAHTTHRNWVAWLFAALARAEPMASGEIKRSLESTRADIITRLLDEQIDFHKKRHAQTTGAAHLCGLWGRILFFSALVLVTLRVACLAAGMGEGLVPMLASLFGSLLPAFSAAVFGFRAYEAFEVLADQSEEMHEALVQARSKIGRIRLERPVASQVLGEELFDTATMMLSDVEGWAQLFRMKAVEA